MSTCARCGLARVSCHDPKPYCMAHVGDEREVIACRDRELANLRSLLRSVTIELEDIRSAFGEDGTSPIDSEDSQHLSARLDSVLETLS